MALCLAALAGCGRSVEVQIPFRAGVGGQPFSCTAAAGGFAPADLRFFVHAVALVDADGNAVPVALADDGTWQNGGVALLDFETGDGSCADGTHGTHTVLTGRVRRGDYRGLRFTVGVPFERNHADPATAEPPLNLGRLHWGWQGGYKFLRFEGEAAGGAFRLHLGSTGCEGSIGDIRGCRYSNRPEVALDGFTPGRSAVLVDLDELLHGAAQVRAANTPAARSPRPLSCMSESDSPDCRQPLAALGIDAPSGQPMARQRLFKLGPA